MGIIRKKIQEISLGEGRNGQLTFRVNDNKYHPLSVVFTPSTFGSGYTLTFHDSYSRDEVEMLRDSLTEFLGEQK